MDVRLETPKRLRGDPEALRRWERSAAVVMAAGIARAVRERVQQEGQTATPYAGPDDTPRGKVVSPRYPGADAGRETKSGARAFRSNAALHAAVKARGRFSPSGGMWDGLSVVDRGRARSEALFRGRSEGQDPAIFEYADGTRRARGARPTNALKAWTVFAKTGVNLLALTEGELRAIEGAVTLEVAERVVRVIGFDVPLTGGTSPSSGVYEILRESWRTK